MLIVPGVEYRERDRSIVVEGRVVTPSVRMFSQLVPVLRRPDMLKGDGVAYYMYRDLPPLEGSWARFDVTVIPPWRVGDELAKTKGHYHSSPAGKPPYPEIYQVHGGEALYLLQRSGRSPSEIMDFIAVRARPGDVVVIPPGYGHVTVNIGTSTLVMSNIIFRGSKSYYEPYEKLRGAAYYRLASGLVRNEEYDEVPEVRFEDPLRMSKPVVLEFLEDESSFTWLRDTERACEMRFLGASCD